MTKPSRSFVLPCKYASEALSGPMRRTAPSRLVRLFLCLVALVHSGAAYAQEETAQQPGEGGTAEALPPPAMIRAFVVPTGGGSGPLQVVAKSQKADADAAPKVLAATDADAVFGSSYQPTGAGAAVIELRSGDKVLADTSGVLKPERAYTFIAWQESPTGWKIKAFPDDPASPNAADRALRVLNFPSGRQAFFSIDRGAETKLPGNAVAEFRAPNKVIGASVKVLAPDGGPPALSNLEVDFSILKSAYIVVVPDNQGRMRPQFIGGGYEEIPVLAPAPAPATASDPVSPEAVKQQRINGARMELEHQQAILNMIKAREAAMGTNANATLRETKLEAEKRLAELNNDLEAARSAAPPPAAP